MKVHYQTILVSVIFLLTYTNSTALGQTERSAHFKSPIPYTVISNTIDPKLTDTDVERRFIYVLVSPRNFTKPNLEGLFHSLSKRFPKPTILLVSIYSNRKDLLKKGELQQIMHLRNSDYVMKGDLATFTRVTDK